MASEIKLRDGINEWFMDSDISKEVSFRKGIGDRYHSLAVSRFSSQVILAEFGKPPYRERTCISGLTIVNSDLDTNVMIVPKEKKVIADARLCLDYCDEGSCGPEYVVDGYFSNGGLVSVSGADSLLKPHVAKIKESMGEDNTKRLMGIFKGVIEDRLKHDENYSFEKLQDLVRNSNLPDSYRNAVRGLLKV